MMHVAGLDICESCMKKHGNADPSIDILAESENSTEAGATQEDDSDSDSPSLHDSEFSDLVDAAAAGMEEDAESDVELLSDSEDASDDEADR